MTLSRHNDPLETAMTTIDTGTHGYTTTKTPEHEIVVVGGNVKGWLCATIVESDQSDRIGTELKLRRKWLDAKFTWDGSSWAMDSEAPSEAQETPSDQDSPRGSDSDSEAPSEAQEAPLKMDWDIGADIDDQEFDDDDEELTPAARMAKQLAKYAEEYETEVNASGKKTKICGDAISYALLTLTANEVAAVISKILGMPADKYSHLNPGQIRMNWGNRLRAAVKRGDIDESDIAKLL